MGAAFSNISLNRPERGRGGHVLSCIVRTSRNLRKTGLKNELHDGSEPAASAKDRGSSIHDNLA